MEGDADEVESSQLSLAEAERISASGGGRPDHPEKAVSLPPDYFTAGVLAQAVHEAAFVEAAFGRTSADEPLATITT